MQENGEAIMARDGALVALMILFGTKGLKLLPICVQALYNLTCINEYFKDIERIAKALINIPLSIEFDPYPHMIKALVNCTRFPRTRSRIIEDGALEHITLMVQTLSTRENKQEFVTYILKTLRFLSDSNECRNELLVRGILDILTQLYTYIYDNKYNQLLLITILYNLLSDPKFTLQLYEICMKIIISLITQCNDITILQYASACLHLFSMAEGTKKLPTITMKIIDILPKLLHSEEPLTKFYTVLTAGSIFFSGIV